MGSLTNFILAFEFSTGIGILLNYIYFNKIFNLHVFKYLFFDALHWFLCIAAKIMWYLSLELIISPPESTIFHLSPGFLPESGTICKNVELMTADVGGQQWLSISGGSANNGKLVITISHTSFYHITHWQKNRKQMEIQTNKTKYKKRKYKQKDNKNTMKRQQNIEKFVINPI